jgi:hypothetical protein
MSSVVWTLGTAFKVSSEHDYEEEIPSIATKMAAKRASTSSPATKSVRAGFKLPYLHEASPAVSGFP